jgi:hypothetical protein
VGESEMKFIAFWEYDPKDTAKVIEKFKKSKTGMKTLYEPHHIGGQTKGFTIFETDDIMVIADYSSYYVPELKMKIFPIMDSAKGVESWLKHHP